MDIYKPVYPGLYYFDTFTFTTLGTSGHRGPDSSKGYANAPWREGDFSIVDGQQKWTVPTTGKYRIEAAGAYGATPGRVVSGEVNLNEGQVITMLVGQQPNPLTANVVDNVTVGGGGGTFISTDEKLLMVASGGDGGSYSSGGEWSLPVPITVGVVASFMNDSGTRMAVASQIAGTLMDFNGSTWVSSVSFPGEIIGYFSDSDIYTYYQTSSTNLRIKEYTYPNTFVKSTDIVLPVAVTAFLLDFSRDGQTFLACNDSLQQSAVYRRENGTWTYKTTVSGQTSTGLDFLGPMSADGNRIVTQIYSSPDTFMRVYDYPWTSYTDYLVYDLINHGSISPDGTFYVTFGNVYSLNTGAVVTSLPGDTLSYQGYTRISGDNKTIFKGISGAYLSIIDYSTPTPVITKTYQATTFLDFYVSPLVNQDGTIFATTDILNKVDVYYKSFVSQPGIFLPSGTGLGISGSGYLTDGQVSNPYFNFLKPQAYVDGGFGNMYWYGHKDEGGFGGGQSPLNKTNQITSLTCNSPQTIVTSSNIGPLGLNKDGTVLYFGTILPLGVDTIKYGNTYRYVYTSGSWNLDFSYSGDSSGFSYNTQIANLSVSDDGNTCVVSMAYAESPTNLDITIIQGTNTSQRTGTTGKVSKDGSTIVYTDTSNLYVNDQKITVLPPGTFISMFDLSSDGKAIAVSSGFQNKFFVTRYPWTTYEIISTGPYAGASLLSISPDGTTVFTVNRDVTQNESIQVYQGSSNVASSDFTVRWVDTLTSCYDGTVFAGFIPKVIQSQNADHQVYFFKYGTDTLNQTETKPSLGMFFAISSDGNAFVSSNTTAIRMYTKQNVATSTQNNHGFPHNYKVKFDLTSNYNGTHDITVTSANTFTFQAFGGPTETTGKVFGTTYGISGGGGYTGSPGDGVSGATCYADPTVTLTDLGAGSNSAGYVTISLIDPPPLKQTWSWSPNFVDTTLRGPWQGVNWSDELQQFLSFSGTSEDGIKWNDASTLLGLFTGRYPSNPVYCTSFSPTLGIYVGIGYDFTVLQLFFKYSYDKVNWINSYQLNSSGFKVIWVPEFNLFIATTQYQAYSSSDGINWTIRYIASGLSSFNQTLVYASSIHRIVTNIAYTDDGISWTPYSIPYYIYSISWSPSLSRFIATTSLNSCQYSSDGITWSSTGVDLPSASWGPTIWSSQNSLFSILSSTQSAYSSDGIHWRVTGHETITIRDIAFSPTSGVYVAAGELSEGYLVSIGGIYWVKPVPVEPITRVAAWAPDKGIILMSDISSYKSSDGIKWTLAATKEFLNIIYSDGLGMFVCTEFPQGNVYYSYDGSNFVDSNFTFSAEMYVIKRITWSRELGMFSGKAYSRDGINWTFSSIDASSVAWCPEQARFVALANTGGNNPTSTDSYYSSDGINWTHGSNLGTIYGIATQMAWSPTLRRFVVACGIYNPSPFVPSSYVILYSNDGINWSQSISTDGFPTAMFWIPELQIFMTSGLYSYDGINWNNISIPVFLPTVWTPELNKIVCEAGYSEVTKTF